MFSVVPETSLPWIQTRYPITFLSYLFYYSLFKSMPYRIKMWKTFKPKWELAWLEDED